MSGKVAGAARRLRVLYPLALAAFPVLSLYASNLQETPPRDVAAPLALALGVTAGALLAAWALLRDPRRAALAVTPLVLAFLSFGHVQALLRGPAEDATTSSARLLLVWMGGALVLTVLASRVRRHVDELTRIAAGVAAVLVALPLATIGAHVVRHGLPGGDSTAHAAAPGAGSVAIDPGEQRDVYYLVFDRYANERILANRYGFDNGPFLDRLRERGFQVADRSHANYPQTAQSLASSLNMAYLQDLLPKADPASPNWFPVYQMVRDHRLGRALRGAGYRYVHVGSWWDQTQTSPIADEVLTLDDAATDFADVLAGTTAWPALSEQVGSADPQGRRWMHYRHGRHQLAALRRVPGMKGPTFAFAHVLLPHSPFAFNADGSYVTEEQLASGTYEEHYRQQLAYLNGQLEALVDELLDVPHDERPIIVLQSDEGPHPQRYAVDQADFRWPDATDAELDLKFSNFVAVHLPGPDAPRLPVDITPVNLWRLVLSHYFGADLEPLPDRSYVYRDFRHPFAWTDVTDRVGSRQR